MATNRAAAPLVGCSQLAPAERVLHHVCKLGVQPGDIDQAISAIQAKTFSWEETVDLARRRWVLPLFAGNLQTQRNLQRHVPDAVERLCRVAQFGAQARTETMLGSFSAVAEALVAQGVDVAFMKGAALCQTVYRPGWRLLNDIDVLVRERHAEAALRALLDRGFELAPTGNVHSHQVSLVRAWTAQEAVVVDLHWQLCNYPGLDFDTEALLGRASKRGTVGTGLVLSAEDTLVHYATQLVVDFLRVNALRLTDIHALAGSGLDWPMLTRTASGAGAAGCTLVALQLAADRGAPVPASVLAELASVCPGSREAAEVLRDPRWPFGRWQLPKSAKHVLLYKLHGQRRQPSGKRQARPVRGLFTARLLAALRQRRLTALGRLIGGVAWAIRLRAARWIDTAGAVGLGGWLRGTLWRSKRHHQHHLPARAAVVGSAAAVRQ